MRLIIAIVAALLLSVAWIVIGSIDFGGDDFLKYELLRACGWLVVAFLAWAVVEIVIMRRGM